MSEEESCDDNEVGDGHGPTPRKVRRLSWERVKLRRVKKKLDTQYGRNMTAKQRRTTATLVVSPVFCELQKPSNCPPWTCRPVS